MKIGLDFDDTYTLDPKIWDDFIWLMYDRGHDIFLVTNRQGDEADQEELSQVPLDSYYIVYTGGKAKHEYVKKEKGIYIDVWIDNEPEFIKDDKFKQSQTKLGFF